jgi:TetR/AcrR family transcriptional regulator, transcriptional repressor for nem operon
MSAMSRRGTQTRQRMLLAAADLFHKQGVRATSPDHVMEASGTGKGQFYHYFASKEGLVHEVLQNHIHAIRTGVAQVDYDVRSWAGLERWFAAHAQLQEQFDWTRGCPFGTIGNELAVGDELVRQDLSLLFEVVRGKLALFFATEKAAGRLASNADEVNLADFCIAAVQGGMLMAKIKRDGAALSTTIDAAMSYLETFRQRPQKAGTSRRPR